MSIASDRRAASAWTQAPEAPRLGPGEVHVWRTLLLAPEATLRGLWHVLSADERARAERFHFRRDRDRFVVARGVLRRILGRYVDENPRRLRFRYGHFGKPSLIGEPGLTWPTFNLSHSHDLALYAVTSNARVGVDVERVRATVSADELAARVFSPSERAALRACPPALRQRLFFRLWTLKEAFIKADGTGLSFPLDKFSVILGGDPQTAVLCVHFDPTATASWSLRELEPGPDYAGAVAMAGHGWRLSCWERLG